MVFILGGINWLVLVSLGFFILGCGFALYAFRARRPKSYGPFPRQPSRVSNGVCVTFVAIGGCCIAFCSVAFYFGLVVAVGITRIEPTFERIDEPPRHEKSTTLTLCDTPLPIGGGFFLLTK